MLTKHCNKCDTTKPIDAFGRDAGRYDGHTYRCLVCRALSRAAMQVQIAEQKRIHYAANRERILAQKREGYAAVADKKREYQRGYTDKNRLKLQEKSKQYYATNPDYYKQFRVRFPDKVNAKEIRRKTAKLQRNPAWLTEDDHWMMEQAYELAALRTKLFGFPWHVDHVIPLQGKLVSGLHTPNNLQVIPGYDNLRKSNRFEAQL